VFIKSQNQLRKHKKFQSTSIFRMNLKAIVFGATGPVGSSVVEQLAAEYPKWTVYAATRKEILEDTLNAFPLSPNVKMVQCDVFDLDSVLSVSKECDVLYSCIGFDRYERKYWAEHWPVVVKNLLNAVTMDLTKKKKLVFCDNIYSYGPGIDINPKTSKPINAVPTSKPGIRAMMRQTFEKHMKDHPGTLCVVGAADLFGPRFRSNSWLGDTLTKNIVSAALNGKRGSSVTVFGSSNVIHDFGYVHDFAKALVKASVNDNAYDKFWICPHAIHDKTQRQICDDIARIAYRRVSENGEIPSIDPVVSIMVLKPWMLYLLSFFTPVLYEMIEMNEFFVKDYSVDDHDFCTVFHVQPTSYEEALISHIDYYIKELKETTTMKSSQKPWIVPIQSTTKPFAC
jgi:nucleoside-diphosphate-sugar epimerase